MDMKLSEGSRSYSGGNFSRAIIFSSQKRQVRYLISFPSCSYCQHFYADAGVAIFFFLAKHYPACSFSIPDWAIPLFISAEF